MNTENCNFISRSEDLEFTEIASENLAFMPPPFNSFQPMVPKSPGKGQPSGPPPNYVPLKSEKGVQSFNSSTKAVSPNSIKFCLYKHTYIWETSGKSYWAYLINVDKFSVSGFRWFGWNWGYFAVDLKRIDSFFCYRSEINRNKPIDFVSINKEYTSSGINEVYSKILTEVSIPDDNIENRNRNCNYRIILEITYPDNLDANIKDKIIDCAENCEGDLISLLNNSRSIINYLSPLEIFNLSTASISYALKEFSSRFSLTIKSIPSLDNICSNITYSIRQDKIITH